jgi:glycosyltransferase involved in cell wall biosynthesis
MSSIAAQNVAILCQGIELYGVGSVQKMYANHLSDVLFVCQNDGALYRWLKQQGKRVMLVPAETQIVPDRSLGTLGSLPRWLRQSRREAKLLHERLQSENIKLLHTNWLSQQLIGLWMRPRGYRIVWQIHNTSSPTRLWGMGLKLNHFFARRAADLLMPVSDYIANFWRASGVPIRTVRNCADPIYNAANTLPPSPLRCLIAGRLDEEKGHHLAIEAVLRARKAGHDVTLDIFGGPLENNPYADRLPRDPAIRFMGFVSDLRQRHQDYHLGLQCRINPEPCSVWVCETLVDGLPLLAAANGGTPELVQNGVSGLLFRSNDVEDLSAKLLQLLGEPDRLAAMRSAAFVRGQQEFTPARFIRETLDAYAAIS